MFVFSRLAGGQKRGGVGCQSIKDRAMVFEEDGGFLDNWIQRARDDAAEWYSTAWLARSVQMPVGRAGQSRALGSSVAREGLCWVWVGKTNGKGDRGWSANRGILRIRAVLGMGGACCESGRAEKKFRLLRDDRQQGRATSAVVSDQGWVPSRISSNLHACDTDSGAEMRNLRHLKFCKQKTKTCSISIGVMGFLF